MAFFAAFDFIFCGNWEIVRQASLNPNIRIASLASISFIRDKTTTVTPIANAMPFKFILHQFEDLHKLWDTP